MKQKTTTSNTVPKDNTTNYLVQDTLSEEEKIAQIATHFAAIMRTLALNMDDPSLKNTPARVARMYVKELFKGLNPANKPNYTLFEAPNGYDQMILEKDIQFFSCCEHHFVPIQGKAHVAYLAKGKIIGLSKINRIVHYYARRPQVQERLTQEIAQEMSRILHTEDVAVLINAKHFCVIARGVSDVQAKTHTSYLGGRFKTAPWRSELFSQIG